MLGEIDKDFYCSADRYEEDICIGTGGCCIQSFTCPTYHRKHPTPEQYKEEYGEEYQKNGAVYGFIEHTHYECKKHNDWIATTLEKIRCHCLPIQKENIVCACTPFGKPDKDWRP